MQPIAKCEKCGREFLTAPKDAIDHYYPLNEPSPPREQLRTDKQCGGKVKSIF